jgi:peptidoglycan/LPS O-acetylase OafA/YrhL
VACTVPFAAASWFLVERPAQRFRRAADGFPWVRSGLRVERRAVVS